MLEPLGELRAPCVLQVWLRKMWSRTRAVLRGLLVVLISIQAGTLAEWRADVKVILQLSFPVGVGLTFHWNMVCLHLGKSRLLQTSHLEFFPRRFWHIFIFTHSRGCNAIIRFLPFALKNGVIDYTKVKYKCISMYLLFSLRIRLQTRLDPSFLSL